MQTECAVCWGTEFPLAGEAEVVWVLWQVPSQRDRGREKEHCWSSISEAEHFSLEKLNNCQIPHKFFYCL